MAILACKVVTVLFVISFVNRCISTTSLSEQYTSALPLVYDKELPVLKCEANKACYGLAQKTAMISLHVKSSNDDSISFKLSTLFKQRDDQYIGVTLQPESSENKALLITCTPNQSLQSYSVDLKSAEFNPVDSDHAHLTESTPYSCDFLYSNYDASTDQSGQWMNLSTELLVSVVRGEFKSVKPANIISKIKSVSPSKLNRQEFNEQQAEIVKPIILAYISVMIFIWLLVFIASNICNFLSDYGLNSSLRKAHGALAAVIIVSSLTIGIGFFVAHVIQDVTVGQFKAPHNALAAVTLVFVLILIVFLALIHTSRFRDDPVFPRYFNLIYLATHTFAVATVLLACAEASDYVQHLVFYITMAICILEVVFEILFEFVRVDRKMLVISVIYGAVVGLLTISCIVFIWMDEK